MSGARFYYLTGIGADLEFALVNMAMDQARDAGFTTMIPPTLVKPRAMEGTGFLGQAADDVYRVEGATSPPWCERWCRWSAWARETHLEWREVGVDAPVLALARTDELKEVLLNVLENARHAQASTVTVDVGVVEAEESAPRVLVTVTDDGHGIPSDVLPRIFEPHFSTRTSGSGLGLAISRQLVEGWGGTISVESSGSGTVVRILLREA